MKAKLSMLMSGTLLLGLFALGFVRTYRIEPVERPQILCSKSECLLFISVEYSGWVGNMLLDEVRALRSYFGVSNPPQQKITRTVLFRILSNTTSRTELVDVTSVLGVFNNTVYLRGGHLKRWTSSGLKDLDSEELDRYREADRSGKVLSGDFENVNGWSAKSYLALGDYNVVLNGRPVSISRKKITHKTVAIEIDRDDQGSETIWQSDDSFRRVSQSTYNRTFMGNSR